MLKVVLFDNDLDPIYVLEFQEDAKSCITVNDLIVLPHIKNGYGHAEIYDLKYTKFGDDDDNALILDTNATSRQGLDTWALWKQYCDPRTDEYCDIWSDEYGDKLMEE